ncbi:unnamed protein product [Pleuronectes platessa]|uniref:Uncharacterized protein n=1 Tax=Pleuronectes platessa TaxID=8262 RepID=A0A9N7Z2H8_PLEPL|nr:unnamed protein product [Pleuronectes platessa]
MGEQLQGVFDKRASREDDSGVNRLWKGPLLDVPPQWLPSVLRLSCADGPPLVRPMQALEAGCTAEVGREHGGVQAQRGRAEGSLMSTCILRGPHYTDASGEAFRG